MESPPRYWFPAIRHGWGWGRPRTWEGWLVLTAYLTTVLVPAVLLPERAGGIAALLALIVGTPLLLWVCFAKGEPPDKPGQLPAQGGGRR